MKQLIFGLMLAGVTPASTFAQTQGHATSIQIAQPASRSSSGPAYRGDSVRPTTDANPRAQFVTLKQDQATHKLPQLPASAASAADDHSGAVTLPANWQN